MRAYPRYLPRYSISDMKNPYPIRSWYPIFRTLHVSSKCILLQLSHPKNATPTIPCSGLLKFFVLVFVPRPKAIHILDSIGHTYIHPKQPFYFHLKSPWSSGCKKMETIIQAGLPLDFTHERIYRGVCCDWEQDVGPKAPLPVIVGRILKGSDSYQEAQRIGKKQPWHAQEVIKFARCFAWFTWIATPHITGMYRHSIVAP